jgi:methylated-DNA-[protein]-cysteine S-methyltransferase
MAASAHGLAGLWFVGQRHMPESTGWPTDAQHPVLQQTQHELEAYFLGQRTAFEVPLDLSNGTDFQQAVWQALLRIAPGNSTAYGTLAAALGKPMASRAVGAAVGRNPISILVPCHRVLGAGGQLTGYAGGLDRKRALLQLESAV